MNQKPENPPVYPQGKPLFVFDGAKNTVRQAEGEVPYVGGLTCRDYFAAALMPSMFEEYFRANGPCFATDHLYKNLPIHVFKMADAMLEARAK